ncbi:DHA2 family efflux MFS transporter permease subunit [Streptomyces sp. LP05-1]|uniref:DHA2 family efflux MFS transporter permease subunit n=1 Tax=Streptomyces pyxinae TaxID=2970734 RepID=A0ABT2CQP8_9ACTN|nr:DHA2 family efflux MFS transporter permease subunit [Streptomyces sp. LP05-1]MCS0639591.1 DHA2 family efflux MFS transporter permease subunit [Streptomyces sp. LP05-1]
MSTTVRATADRPSDRLEPAVLKLGSVLVLGTILAVLDSTVVNVGIEAIRSDFGSSLATVQWISTGYLLAFALVAPISGWATNRFGAKRVWMTSVACFVLGSALCGLAWSAASLIVFRVLQGIGGGLIQPVGQSMIAQAAGPKRIGRVMSLLIIPLTFAPALGPVVGGVLIGLLSWQWIFYINIPLGALTLLLAARVLPSSTPEGGQRLDVLGLALISPGLAAIIYGFSETGNGHGFADTVVHAPVAVGALLLIAYAVHALRPGSTPVLDLRLFGRRAFSHAILTSFLVGAALFSSMFMLPLYYQQARGQDALHAGLLLIPQDLGIAVAMFFAGRITSRLGLRTVMLVGIALAMAGTLAYTQVGEEPGELLLSTALFVRGLGLGGAMSPMITAVFQSVAPHQMPQAAGINNVVHRIGGSLGTATLVIVLQHHTGGHGGSLADAFGTTFWWALGISALTLLPGLALPGRARD